MAKSKSNIDVDGIKKALQAVNEAEIFDSPIEFEDLKDSELAEMLIEVLSNLEEEDLKTIPTYKDIVEVHNNLPSEFFESSDSDEEEETLPEDEESSEESDESSDEEDVSSDEEDDSDDKFEPSCPTFGEYSEDNEECLSCKETYEDEYSRCVKLVMASGAKKVKKVEEEPEEEPIEEEKPKKENKASAKKDENTKKEKKISKKVEEEPIEEDNSEEEPVKEEKPKRGRPSKKKEPVEEEPVKEEKAEEKPKKDAFKKPIKKQREEDDPDEKPKINKKSITPALTGKKLAEYFKRVSIGGINECVVKSTKKMISVDAVCIKGNVMEHVVASFGFPYEGEFGVSDISKIITFATKVGDSEIDMKIDAERFHMKSYNNKVSLMNCVLDAIKTCPVSDDEDGELDPNELIEACNYQTVVPLDVIKDLRFDTKLIKSEKLYITIDDGKLFLIGGDSATDKFEIELKVKDVPDDVNCSWLINGKNFSECLSICSLNDSPIELYFNTEEEVPVVICQGKDIWAFSLETEVSDGE